MTKPIRRRDLTVRDLRAVVLHYRNEGGPDVAARFIAATQAAFRAISARPGAGSPRYAEQLSLADLRHRPLAHFPYLIFYVERADHVEIWRVLHARRDIESVFRSELERE